jgi:pyruvate-ferredoxin/flavodoxin oxidoreductase
MKEVEKATGRPLNLYSYKGVANPESIIVLMCSGAETAIEAVDYLEARGKKVI